jgi:pyruvate dehydrogenase (quinone)
VHLSGLSSPQVACWRKSCSNEQTELHNPSYGCELGTIDNAQIATACGAEGQRCTSPAGLKHAINSLLRSSRAALLDVHVDPVKPITMPGQLSV